MSYTDALTRISQIGSEVSGLQAAFTPPASTSPSGGATIAQGTGTGTFSTQLASAMAGSTAAAVGLDQTTGLDPTAGLGGLLPGGGLPLAGGVVTGTGLPAGYAGATGAAGSGTLPAGASVSLTTGQQRFASRLAADTGLDPGVVTAWLLAEENGGAAVSRQSAGNNDWLNIGYTDGGTYGAADSVWSDPVAAADATAGWLRGQDTIPGYGTASGGIQAILQTAGQGPAAQIAAIQGSGWASGGYPELGTLYQQVAG
ncbi:MAG: hypothetical protein ACRDNJ_09040 [Solirubrobacteraceae bacterium]